MRHIDWKDNIEISTMGSDVANVPLQMHIRVFRFGQTCEAHAGLENGGPMLLSSSARCGSACILTYCCQHLPLVKHFTTAYL